MVKGDVKHGAIRAIEGGYVRWVDTNSSYLVKKVLKWAFMALLRDIRDFVSTNFM